MSWASDAYAAIRKIILIEQRIDTLSEQVKGLADAYCDIDRRLVRLEAKFELLEKVATSGGRRRPRPLPEKPEG